MSDFRFHWDEPRARRVWSYRDSGKRFPTWHRRPPRRDRHKKRKSWNRRLRWFWGDESGVVEAYLHYRVVKGAGWAYAANVRVAGRHVRVTAGSPREAWEALLARLARSA